MVTAEQIIGSQSVFAQDFRFRTPAYQDWVKTVEADPATAPAWPEFRDAHPSNRQRPRKLKLRGHANLPLGPLSGSRSREGFNAMSTEPR